MNSPYFTVVVPTYNRAPTIEPTLRSVQSQTLRDFECIIIDDGSDDVDQLEELVRRMADPRFKVIRRPNGGGGAARNTGITHARGQYIAFLDSDDRFLPTKLEIVHRRLAERPSAALYSYAKVDRGIDGKYWLRPDRPIRADESMADYLFIANQFVQTSTIIISTESARGIMFNPDLRKGQDLDFCVRAYASGVHFQMIEEPLIVWTDIDESGRTSRQSGVAAPQEWLDGHAEILGRRAVLGYRATVLSYYQPKHLLPRVLYDLTVAVFCAGVPLRIAARHLLRFCLPRTVYRNVVSVAVRALGRSTSA